MDVKVRKISETEIYAYPPEGYKFADMYGRRFGEIMLVKDGE